MCKSIKNFKVSQGLEKESQQENLFFNHNHNHSCQKYVIFNFIYISFSALESLVRSPIQKNFPAHLVVNLVPE